MIHSFLSTGYFLCLLFLLSSHLKFCESYSPVHVRTTRPLLSSRSLSNHGHRMSGHHISHMSHSSHTSHVAHGGSMRNARSALFSSFGFASSRRTSTATFLSLSTTRLFAQLEKEKSTGDVTVLERKQKEQTVNVPNFRQEIEKNWRLILHDDDIHTIDDVVDWITELVPLCPTQRAYEVTLMVDTEGSATVCVASKKLIAEYFHALQATGLTVSMAPDEEFEPDGQDGGPNVLE